HEKAQYVALFSLLEVELNAVGMNVVGLVVEAQRGSVSGTKPDFRLLDLDREIQRVVGPVDVGERGKLLRLGVRFFGSPVLIFDVELAWLFDVETFERAIKRGRLADPQARRSYLHRRVNLEQRHERLLHLSPAAEPDGGATPLDGPTAREHRVALASPRCFDFDRVATHPHRANHRLARRAFRN